LLFMKVNNLFKAVNTFMAAFCLAGLASNYCRVKVLSSEKAVSSLNGESFEYSVERNRFSMVRNGKLVGMLPISQNLKFKRFVPELRCNAIAIGVKAIVVGGTALAGGAGLGAAAGAAGTTFVADAGLIGGAAMAAGGSVAELPGAAAVAATLGGAGEVAAAAAVEAAAVGAGTAALAAVGVVVGAAAFGAGLA
jgi:hypothetical protein